MSLQQNLIPWVSKYLLAPLFLQCTQPAHNNTVTVPGVDTRTFVVGDLLPGTSYTFLVRAQGAAVSNATSGTMSTAIPTG